MPTFVPNTRASPQFTLRTSTVRRVLTGPRSQERGINMPALALWPSSPCFNEVPHFEMCGHTESKVYGMERKRNIYFTYWILDGIIQPVNNAQTFAESELERIRLMQNPYASLSIRDTDEDDETIVRPNHPTIALGITSEPLKCTPLL